MNTVLLFISVVVGIIGLAFAYLRYVKKKKTSAAILILTLTLVVLLNVIVLVTNYVGGGPPSTIEKSLEQLGYVNIEATKQYIEAKLGPPQLEEDGYLYTRVNYNFKLFYLAIVYYGDEVIQYTVLSKHIEFKPIIDYGINNCLGCFSFTDAFDEAYLNPVIINYSAKDCYYVEELPSSMATNNYTVFLIYACHGVEYKKYRGGSFIELYDIFYKNERGSQLSTKEKALIHNFRATTIPNSYTVRGSGDYEEELGNYGDLIDPFIDWFIIKRL